MNLKTLILSLIIFFTTTQGFALEKVTLQLKWKHQFQFAGYYAAQIQGYYKEAGLEVVMVEAKEGNESIPAVVTGEAEYGVATTDLLLSYEQGFPVVLLANIFQHSPHIFLSLKKDGLENVHDLARKTLMLEEDALELKAYLKIESIPLKDIHFVTHDFSPQKLISGEVHAISAYSTDEPYLLKEMDIPYFILNPRSSGIDFYGDLLFTSQKEINLHPNRVQAFLTASLKGWRYALEHDEEVVQYIYNTLTQRHSIEHLRFEAEQTKRLIVPDIVETGYINPKRWERIREIYKDLGLVSATKDLNEFFYHPETKNYDWLLNPIFLLTVSFSIVVSFLALRYFNLSKKLKHESQTRREKEEDIRSMEERYHILIENAPFPVLITTEKGQCLYMNQLALDSFQVNWEMASKQFIEVFYEEVSDRQKLLEQLQYHGFSRNDEMKLKGADGHVFWVQMSSSLIRFESQKAIFSAFINISHRVQLEEELQSVSTQKDQMFHYVAHDLRQFFWRFSMVLPMIDEEQAKNDSVSLKLLKSTATQSHEILQDLLLWIRLQQGGVRLNCAQHRMSDFFKDQEKLLSTVHAEKKIVTEISCDVELQAVFDRDLLGIVFEKLIRYNVEAFHGGETIVMRAIEKTGTLVLSLEDNGPGIDAYTLTHLFEGTVEKEGAQQDQSPNGKSMGLKLSKELVEFQGGHFWVQSQKGVGSIFSIELPSSKLKNA